MSNNKSINDYLRAKVIEDIIKKYLFIQTLEKEYGDEYIKTKYGISPATIRKLYATLGESEKLEIEDTLKKQIEEKELDLSEEAKIWHNSAFKKKRSITTETEIEKG